MTLIDDTPFRARALAARPEPARRAEPARVIDLRIPRLQAELQSCLGREQQLVLDLERTYDALERLTGRRGRHLEVHGAMLACFDVDDADSRDLEARAGHIETALDGLRQRMAGLAGRLDAAFGTPN